MNIINKLPKSYRQLARIREAQQTKIPEFHFYLDRAFEWHLTPEGKPFWRSVYKNGTTFLLPSHRPRKFIPAYKVCVKINLRAIKKTNVSEDMSWRGVGTLHESQVGEYSYFVEPITAKDEELPHPLRRVYKGNLTLIKILKKLK